MSFSDVISHSLVACYTPLPSTHGLVIVAPQTSLCIWLEIVIFLLPIFRSMEELRNSSDDRILDVNVLSKTFVVEIIGHVLQNLSRAHGMAEILCSVKILVC